MYNKVIVSILCILFFNQVGFAGNIIPLNNCSYHNPEVLEPRPITYPVKIESEDIYKDGKPVDIMRFSSSIEGSGTSFFRFSETGMMFRNKIKNQVSALNSDKNSDLYILCHPNYTQVFSLFVYPANFFQVGYSHSNRDDKPWLAKILEWSIAIQGREETESVDSFCHSHGARAPIPSEVELREKKIAESISEGRIGYSQRAAAYNEHLSSFSNDETICVREKK